MMIVYLVASLISVPFTCLLKERVARKTLYLSVVASMSDTPPCDSGVVIPRGCRLHGGPGARDARQVVEIVCGKSKTWIIK